MKTVSLQDAEKDLDALVREVEQGEVVTLTRNGKPVLDLVPHVQTPKKAGIDWEAGQAYLRSRGITDPFPSIAGDFDDPLPEDFLLKPLP